VGGTWDYDKMRQIIPDIDYKAAGLSDADLNMIGVDFLLQTEGENGITAEFGDLMGEADAEHERELAWRREARTTEAAGQGESPMGPDDVFVMPPDPEQERQAKIDHMKDVKQQVRDNAQKTAQNMDAYVMLSFSSWEAKALFCQRFGYDPYVKFIKGEVFDEQVERVE
jgi:putative DNA (cytosine-5-)-methyltransferase